MYYLYTGAIVIAENLKEVYEMYVYLNIYIYKFFI